MNEQYKTICIAAADNKTIHFFLLFHMHRFAHPPNIQDNIPHHTTPTHIIHKTHIGHDYLRRHFVVANLTIIHINYTVFHSFSQFYRFPLAHTHIFLSSTREHFVCFFFLIFRFHCNLVFENIVFGSQFMFVSVWLLIICSGCRKIVI